MKVHNLRVGFATNSSSSHSIVMIPRGQHEPTNEYNRFNYGWEEFTLADPESKSAYFVTQLVMDLENGHMQKSEIVLAVNSLLSTEYTVGEFSDCGVDHQSVWGNLGHMFRKHPELVQHMHEFIKRDDVVILGGNDNSDGQTPPDNSFTDARTEAVNWGSDVQVRQDGENWCLFNAHSGAKIRVSFLPHTPEYVKSSVPELVDLKISDYCSVGCEFCYQSSTKAGKHADLDNIKTILNSLGDMGVFEVAIGGGEPTQYPHLIQVLEHAAAQNIVPNFTTFMVDWLKNDKLVKAVKDHVGAIGVSVHSAKELNKITKIEHVLNGNRGWGDRRVQVTAQHVVGSVDISETAQLLDACWDQGVDLLLLGYKPVGFGALHAPYDLTGLDTLLRLRRDRKPHWRAKISMLGVDTAFVQQFGSLLTELEIPQVLVTSEEGKFSMYVDAVTLTQGPSSYMPDQMEPLDMTNVLSDIKRAYVKW
jgi:organic radical activating enzyme